MELLSNMACNEYLDYGCLFESIYVLMITVSHVPLLVYNQSLQRNMYQEKEAGRCRNGDMPNSVQEAWHCFAENHLLWVCKIPKQLNQCRNISEWRRFFILVVWLRRKGIIISVSLNRAMAAMSNQLKSRLESGVTTLRLHQVKTGQKCSQLILQYSLNSLRLL